MVFYSGYGLSFLPLYHILNNFSIGYLFEALSFFSFICWAAPNSTAVNQLFGVRTGLGMSFLTFDWSQISWIGSPLMGAAPFFSIPCAKLISFTSSMVGRSQYFHGLRLILLDRGPNLILYQRMALFIS